VTTGLTFAYTDGPLSPGAAETLRRLRKVPHVTCAGVVSSSTAVDFILDLSEAGVEVAVQPPLGIWRLRYGLGAIPHVHVALECVMQGVRTVLETAVVNADPASYEETAQRAILAGADLPSLAVRRWALRGGVLRTLDAQAIGPDLKASSEMRRKWAWAAQQVSAIFKFEMWNVGIVRHPITAFLEPGFRPKVEWLPRLDAKRYVADPFVAQTGEGRPTLLMEEFDYDRYQGFLSCQAADAAAGPPEVFLDEKVHMSYPFPVRHEGELYLIPECQNRREVAIYRYKTSSWERAGTLLRDFAALDSTVFEWNGKWWMLNTCQDDLPECKLFIWHADSLFGPWEPHALNPVKCDVRSSRPGGTPFVRDGVLYRPAQDSSKSYGGAVTINRVVRLTGTEFAEEPVAHVEPLAPYLDGIHTISSAGDFTVIDGKKMTVTPQLTGRRLRHKLKRLLGYTKR
jgi:hypothetical protein